MIDKCDMVITFERAKFKQTNQSCSPSNISQSIKINRHTGKTKISTINQWTKYNKNKNMKPRKTLVVR